MPLPITSINFGSACTREYRGLNLANNATFMSSTSMVKLCYLLLVTECFFKRKESLFSIYGRRQKKVPRSIRTTGTRLKKKGGKRKLNGN